MISPTDPHAYAQLAPNPPTNLTAVAVSSSQINLNWQAPSGGGSITGYEIERSTDGGSTWNIIVPSTGSTATTYSDTGLAASTTYTYRVSTVALIFTSSPSNTSSATTQGNITAPQPPTGLTATAASSSQINLSWTAPSNNGGSAITGYKIERSTNGGTTWSTIQSNTGSTGTTYSDTGLVASTTYTYRVSAINSVGTSSPSGITSATTQSNITAPSSPTGLTATAASSSQINLSWTAPSNNGGSAITGYKIERSPDGTTWSTLVANTGSTSTTYSDTGLAASTTYTYRVSAINSVGTSSPSGIASATTQSTSTASQPPTGLTATSISSSQINLSWTAPSNNGGSPITGYMVERSTDGGTTWSTIQSNTGSTTTTYSDTGLVASTTYTYRVSAINSVGTSSPSGIASATTQPTSTGAAITISGIQSTSGTVLSPSFQFTLANVNAGTGNNRLLVVGVAANNENVASVTFGGVQMTQAASSFTNNDAEFWYLVNPSGTGNVVVTMSGPTSAVVGAYSISGVDQTNPIPTKAAQQGTASSPSISITTKFSNSMILDLPSIYGGVTLGSPTCTQGWDVNVQNAITGASSSLIDPSPGSATCSWTASPNGDSWDDVAVEVKAAASSVPGAPTGLIATSISSSQINLSWTAPSNNGGSAITGYKIERSPDGTTWSTLVANTGSTSTTYSDTGLAASTTYTYRVSAINSVGTSSPSNTASATTQSNITAPSSPTGLTATAVSSSQINLSWTAPSNNGGSAITGYKIERSPDGTTWSTIQSNTGTTGTTYSDTGLAASTAYTYRVSAINSVGTSSPSNTASATTQSNIAAPQPPTGLTATAVTSSQINLSWTAPANNGGSPITGYKIERSTNGSSTWNTMQSNTGSTSTTYSDTGLAVSTTYTYRVSAINSVGTSSPSNTASATTTSSIKQIKSGLVISDSLTNETETQQQLQSSHGYWMYGGDAPAENAPYAISRGTQGFHNGVQAPANGTWAGYYGTTKNTTAYLFHAVITTPVNSVPSNNNWYENGLYVQTFEPGPVNYVSCTSLTGKGYIQWVVFAATGNNNEVTNETTLFVDTSPNQPLTRDCTMITNGNNFLQVYLDGDLVVNRTNLNLQMPEPFNSYLEPQTSYAGQLLNGTFTNYYAAANGNVTVSNLPVNAARVDIDDSSGNVLATSKALAGSAILDVGRYDFPFAGTIKAYDINNTLITSTPGAVSIYGGDVYSAK